MAEPLVTDESRERIRPLSPPPGPRRIRSPGPEAIDDRECLTGTPFVLKAGIDREDLPREVGCGRGMTCGRRLRHRDRAGVRRKAPEAPPAEPGGADRIDRRRAVIDGRFVRARGGGGRTGPRPVGRRKRGGEHAIITEGGGMPSAATTAAANVPDVVPMTPPVDAIPPVRGERGRPRRRPEGFYGDRGLDPEEHRRQPRRRGLRPVIARRRTGRGSGSGGIRRVVGRTPPRRRGFGRRRVRKDRTPAIHDALLTPGCATRCLNSL